MNKLSTDEFERAIHARLGVHARLHTREFVRESLEGAVWEGEVLVFVVLDHPSTTSCYAWSRGERVTAVLGLSPVTSAAKAVRAVMAAEAR